MTMAVMELRVALTTEHWDAVVRFYQEGLGLDPGDIWTDNGRGQIFYAGRGTLEVFDPQHAQAVDTLEVGHSVSGMIRFAFEVADVRATLQRALDYGATLVHEPVLTPWNHLNARVKSPDGLQVTLFQVMGT
jgi:lactoylglutathione lyase